VADEDVFAVLRAPLVEATRAGGWILDGIPRTVGQARALDEMLANMDATPQLIVALEIPADESAERLRQRGSVEDRPDDAEPVVAHRLALWAREGPPLLDWYERQKRLTRIDGRGDSITVEDRVWAMIHRANL
jgi:adenylate kinase